MLNTQRGATLDKWCLPHPWYVCVFRYR